MVRYLVRSGSRLVRQLPHCRGSWFVSLTSWKSEWKPLIHGSLWLNSGSDQETYVRGLSLSGPTPRSGWWVIETLKPVQKWRFGFKGVDISIWVSQQQHQFTRFSNSLDFMSYDKNRLLFVSYTQSTTIITIIVIIIVVVIILILILSSK